MKDEITILYEAPMILTKNKEWAEEFRTTTVKERGRIILLPEDAVLVSLPINVQVTTQEKQV